MDTYNIKQGDVLETLKSIKDKSIDCIITSPPYNQKNKGGDISVEYNSYNDNKENKSYENWQIEILNECFRVLKDNGHMFYNHKPRYEKGEHIHPLTFINKSKLYFYQEIIWQTKRRIDNGGYRFTPQTERIYWLKKDKNNLNKLQKSFITSDLWELGRSERQNNHPAPFPLTLPLRILWSLYGDDNNKNILDIFSGSGTVGVASKILKHNFLGIELDDFYCSISIQRINNITDWDKETWSKEKEKYIVKNSYKSKKENK